MDRVISLLAALVGLIALGAAVMVHVQGDTQRQSLMTELAAVKAAMASIATPPPASVPIQDSGIADELLALQSRVATLEAGSRNQASALEATRSALAALPAPRSAPQEAVASAVPKVSSQPAEATATADGPTTDCIPVGTRFMGQSGDSFPICRTRAVVKVAAVSDGTAIIEGAGPIAAGGFGTLETKGCTVMVFSADTSGYAEMRVACQ